MIAIHYYLVEKIEKTYNTENANKNIFIPGCLTAKSLENVGISIGKIRM